MATRLLARQVSLRCTHLVSKNLFVSNAGGAVSLSKFRRPFASSNVGNIKAVSDEELVSEFVKRLQDSEDVGDAVVAKLDSDCKLRLVNAILDASEKPTPYEPAALSGRHRRAIAISTLSELRGVDPTVELSKADENSDGVVDPSELRRWIKDMILQDSDNDTNSSDYSPPTNLQWFRLCAVTALPMVFFGMMDNGIMILAGESVEKTIAVKFTLSTMACAGLGNLVSDVVGLGAGRWVETMALKSGLIENPNFTEEQQSRHESQIRTVRIVSSVLGISVGCIIGMAPLLIME